MEWFYAKFGKQEGPVDESALRSKIRSGEVSPSDLVWREGMEKWEPAGQVAELQAGPAAAPGGSPGETATGGTGAGLPGTAGPGVPLAAPVPTSGMAIASLVCGIVGICLCYVHGLCALPAVICGHMALKQINSAPVPVGGRGMAVAGLVTGYIGLLFQVGWIVLLTVAIMNS
ncbi:MAG: DUF4339 domain-containing protein [Akkermansiaceae bacterium]|nr:DUF4339 domain-containing protein [Akkermansiaceae bacterium]